MGRERNIEIEFDVWVVGSSIKLLVAKREDVFEFVGSRQTFGIQPAVICVQVEKDRNARHGTERDGNARLVDSEAEQRKR